MKVLITGTAGFIGFHLANRLIKDNWEVTGLDCINDYYDIRIKYDRLCLAGIPTDAIDYNLQVKSTLHKNYTFVKLKLEDNENLEKLFKEKKFDIVINLAAQAGVRYSMTNPQAYVNSNIIGFVNLLECCRHYSIKHLAYASSSSVYGANETMPFSPHQGVDHPLSLYAASKKSNEMMAHVYSHLFALPTTGLRFFTVYGPWGRPDMALFLFTKAILENKPIQVFNHGLMERNFTYVDDIVEGIVRALGIYPTGNPGWDGMNPDPASSKWPYKLYNIGNDTPVKLTDFIIAIEKKLGRVAQKEMLPLQPGDVPKTFADISDLMRDTGFKPQTSIDTGITKFLDWYTSYYDIYD